MASKSATLRVILSMLPDTDEPATEEWDSASLPDPLPALAGYKASVRHEIALAAAAADQAVAFTSAIAVVLISDKPFTLRLVAGQALLSNLRTFILWADDVLDGIHTTSVLLTGNGTEVANITAIVIEKPV